MCAAWSGCREIRDRCSPLTPTEKVKGLRVLSCENAYDGWAAEGKRHDGSYVNFANVVERVKPWEGRMLRCADLYSSRAAFAPSGRRRIMIP